MYVLYKKSSLFFKTSFFICIIPRKEKEIEVMKECSEISVCMGFVVMVENKRERKGPASDHNSPLTPKIAKKNHESAAH